MKSSQSSKELAKQECECEDCGAVYWSRTRCDDPSNYCPVCKAPAEDQDEITGVL